MISHITSPFKGFRDYAFRFGRLTKLRNSTELEDS